MVSMREKDSIQAKNSSTEYIAAFDHLLGVSITIFVKDSLSSMSESIYCVAEDYDELMSNNPDWAIGKSADDFRVSDLWIMVDRIRANGPAKLIKYAEPKIKKEDGK